MSEKAIVVVERPKRADVVAAGPIIPVGAGAGSVAWDDVTGKPAAFPPDTHNHDGEYAAAGHDHGGTYQPAGSYASASHTHDESAVAASYTAGGTTSLTYQKDAVYHATAATGSTTWAITGLPAAGTLARWTVEVTNGGSQTQNWFANTKWDGGIAPTLTAAGLDILTFYTRDAGATIRGFLAAKDSK